MIDDEFDGSSVMAFARVKYWARKLRGPRDGVERPEELQRAARLLIEAFEIAWRAGCSHPGLLMRVVQQEVKELGG